MSPVGDRYSAYARDLDGMEPMTIATLMARVASQTYVAGAQTCRFQEKAYKSPCPGT
jgi:hypothetical protein